MAMIEDPRLKARVVDKVTHFLDLARERHHQSFSAGDIRFDLKGTAAGCCVVNGQDSVLRFNPILLAENAEEFLARTVPHEVAHLVAYRRYGKKIRPHGDEWKAVMALFGADDKRCHQFDVSSVRQRRYRYFDYRCGCSEHQLTAVRHNRILKGNRYLCRHCGQVLKAVKQTQ